jgi:hypothetical protein
LALYQAVTGPEADKKIFKQFSPDFFDLIVVDECHPGSADDDSAWREILTYFDSATQIGLTATPRETRYISNIDYFGQPAYLYSLRQGIDDGFLAPYKVVRIDLDKDLVGWRPTQGKTDKHGQVIEDREFGLPHAASGRRGAGLHHHDGGLRDDGGHQGARHHRCGHRGGFARQPYSRPHYGRGRARSLVAQGHRQGRHAA